MTRSSLALLLFAAAACGAEAEPKTSKDCLTLADACEACHDWDGRVEALRKAVFLDHDNAEAHARLDEVKSGALWMRADLAEQKEAEEREAKGLVFYGKGWIQPKEADALRQADRKTVGWDPERRVDTPHLILYSSQSLAFTRRLGATLENEMTAYRRLYTKVWKLEFAPKPFKVYVFKDHVSFGRMVKKECAMPVPAGMAGLYSKEMKTLYVGLSENESEGSFNADAVMCTAVHEMLHGMDDQLAHSMATEVSGWIGEGRADYFAYAIFGRQVLPGLALMPPGDDEAEMVSDAVDGVSLKDLMVPNTPGFCQHANAMACYAEAWAWTHFLFHGEGGKHAEAFRKFLSGVPNRFSTEDFEKAAGKLPDLTPAFKEFVQQAFLPSVKKM